MGARLAYLDTLKVLLVVGVIAMHTAITYGLTVPGTSSRTTKCPVRWSIS
jgi:hypothetical protein